MEWTYTATPPSSFYADGLSGVDRLKDGTTLICNGVEGKFFQITSDGTIIWQYVNPYPGPVLNDVFKIIYIPPEEPSEHEPNLYCNGTLSWSSIQPGQTVTGFFQVQNIGENSSLLNWEINTSSISWGTWSFSPEQGSDLTPEDGPVTIQVSVIAPNEKNMEFTGYIKVENTEDPQDFDIVSVSLQTSRSISFSLHSSILRLFFERFSDMIPFLRHLIR